MRHRWDGQLSEADGFYNVVMDLHNYDCYGSGSGKTAEEHIAQVS